MTRQTARGGLVNSNGEAPVRLTRQVFNRSSSTPRDWCRIENKAGSDSTDVYIMDEIGFWGTTADQFVNRLQEISTPNITLHLNSPGGEVFDGVAIYNALRQHPARVKVQVDALAASAASFIAQAGDEIVMSRGSTMMIHDGLGFAFGNQQDMLETANILDKISNNIADIYSARAGGGIDKWRALMREEVWYTAQEAVDAGLADSVATDVAPAEAVEATNRWDLTVFNHASRDDAPSPGEVERIITNRAKEAPVAQNKPRAEAQTSGDGGPETTRVPEQPGTPSDPQMPEVKEPVDGPDDQDDDEKRSGVSNQASTGNSTGPHFTVLVNGVATSDAAAVQAHINSLEGFRRETLEANRKEFVQSLVKDQKIGASQQSGVEAFALGLSSDQYEAWKATYDDAPALPFLGSHAAGTSNHDGDAAVKDAKAKNEIDDLKAIVRQHKMGGMPEDKIKLTPSYNKLIQLVPEFQL